MAQPAELNLLVKAMSFAANKHKHQRRRGKEASPYINHPIGPVEVLVDKSLSRAGRKQAQIDHARHLSNEARAVKLADKICNLGDVAKSPPNWSLNRRQQYFDWAKKVIDELRGEWSELEAEFDRCYQLRPTK